MGLGAGLLGAALGAGVGALGAALEIPLTVQLAVTTAGPESAYAATGHNRYPIRDYLRPLEQTTRLCNMTFLAPLVLFGALKAENATEIEQNAECYGQLLAGLSTGRVPVEEAASDAVLTFETVGEKV